MSWRVANVGLVSTRMGAIAFSPDFATDKTVFAGMWGRVAKSTDGGARWHTAHLWSSTIRWLAWSLGMDNRSPVFPRVIAASPNFVADGTLFVGIRQSGLYSSTDAGETYSKVWNTDGKPVLALAFSPTFADDGTAVAVLTDSLHKTTDRGHSWLPIRDCDGSCRPALAMSPDFRRDQTIFAADHSGLLRTQDGGATWQSLSTAQCCQAAIDGIALSPAFATDHELLMSLTGIGLLRSRDGGSSFEPVAQSVTDLGVSLSRFVDFPDRAPSVRYSTQFADDETIVASSWETLFFSSDRGERWSPIPPPPIRYENTHSAIVYHGSWQLRVRGDRYSGTSVAASEAPGVDVVMRFVGHGFRLIASRGPDQGTAELSLDGEVIMEIDQYAPNREYVVVSAARMDLAPGRHELRLKVTGSRSTASLGTRVELDSGDVLR